MKKTYPLLVLVTLISFSGSTLFAQSKLLFNPGLHLDNLFKSEIRGGALSAGLEYRPKAWFGLETKVKIGFYGFSENLYPSLEGFSGIVLSNGYVHYSFNSPQIGIAPKFYYDLEIFGDGLSLYAETEFSFGVMSGDIEITGDTKFNKTFSDPISYYSISIGLEQWIDRSHFKKRDSIIAASVGLTSWNLKKSFEKYLPNSYNGSSPLFNFTLRLFLTLKIPISPKGE